jgi:hypothetical protein
MSETIILFPEHDNFVAGKTKLQRWAVFDKSLVVWALLIGFPILIVFIILLGVVGGMSNGTAYFPAIYITALFIVVIGLFFLFGMPYLKYKRLQDSGIPIEANITKIGEELIKIRKSGNQTVYFADYEFHTPNNKLIQSKLLSGRQNNYPRHIRIGDKILILYADDETFCVL